MDYLSGSETLSSLDKRERNKEQINIKRNDIFANYCNTVMKMLNADERMLLAEKFLTPEIVSVIENRELIECIDALFKNNLNLSETSRGAFLHRNTLLYRIEKIYKLTGLNVRNFEDAMSFKILSIVYEKSHKGSNK